MSTVFTFSNTTNSVPEIFTFISNVFCGCDKKKKFQRYIKLKFKYRLTFIHVAVSKVLMLISHNSNLLWVNYPRGIQFPNFQKSSIHNLFDTNDYEQLDTRCVHCGSSGATIYQYPVNGQVLPIA